MVATAIIGSSIIGGISSAIGASKAAKAQTQGAQAATDAQMKMFNQTQTNLQPFIQAGREGVNPLVAAIPGLAAPINMSQEFLESTPGYKFNLASGLKAAYNSASARGLGASGAAIKGAETFASNLADNTYQNQFTNALANKQMALQALQTPVNLGANAAAGLGTIAQGTGGQIGENIIGAANAQGASKIAAANALGGIGNNALIMAMAGKQTGLFS